MNVDLPGNPILRDRLDRKLRSLRDEATCHVFHEIDKLADSGALRKERVAILNDRYDVYVLEPSLPAPKVIVVVDPGRAEAIIVDFSDRTPNPRAAASASAEALGEAVDTIHVFQRR